MQFTPRSEKELSEENLFPAGTYPFEIVAAEDKVSKKGNEMIELKLRVFHGERTQFVNDYLLESIGYKLRHAAVTLGLEAKYDSGQIAARDFAGKEGWAKIKITSDKTGTYPDKNEVGDYVTEPKSVATSSVPTKSKPDTEEEAADDIPF